MILLWCVRIVSLTVIFFFENFFDLMLIFFDAILKFPLICCNNTGFC